MKSTIARVQYEISTADLAVVLTLARVRTLAQAGLQTGVAASTIFRTVQRIERGLGQRLFERSRSGYKVTDLGELLCRHATAIESELQAARCVTLNGGDLVAGLVRVSAVEAVLQSFVVPVVKPLFDAHPRLRMELIGSNNLQSLMHRDVDIAVRSTDSPPEHLIGRRLGTMHFAVYGAASLGIDSSDANVLSLPRLAALPWIGIDEAMPMHPGVRWRRKFLPMVQPVLQVNSMAMAVRAAEQGIGVAVMALFNVRQNTALLPASPTLDQCEIGLWLLTHPESRHLQRISVVAHHIEEYCLANGIDGG